MRVALVAGSVLISLIALELGCRVWRGGPALLLHWPNLVWDVVRDRTDWPVCSHRHDKLLGWAPTPGFASAHYNVGPDGYRHTGELGVQVTGKAPVLALGDSFTEGDEVDDRETWPAYLQELMARRVANGGVSGFGLDQIVLHAGQAAAALKPALVIAALPGRVLVRTERSRMFTLQKPWFEPKADDSLVLHLPAAPDSDCDVLAFWRRFFGWSVLVETVAHRLRWRSWLYDDIAVLPKGSGDSLACPLMKRLTAIDAPVLIVTLSGRSEWVAGELEPQSRREIGILLDCATRLGFAALDLTNAFQQALKQRGLDALYREEHFSPEGSRLVAAEIAAELERRQWPR